MNRYRSLVQVSRRDFLKLAGVGATSVALSNFLAACAPAAGAPATLNVLVPAAPDPAPPGVAKFSEEAFAQWKKENNAEISPEKFPRITEPPAGSASCRSMLMTTWCGDLRLTADSHSLRIGSHPRSALLPCGRAMMTSAEQTR